LCQPPVEQGDLVFQPGGELRLQAAHHATLRIVRLQGRFELRRLLLRLREVFGVRLVAERGGDTISPVNAAAAAKPKPSSGAGPRALGQHDVAHRRPAIARRPRAGNAFNCATRW
jgi:hypothetical protein